MRAVWITRHGGPEVLEVRESPEPVPGPGEVRVRVRAAGLNFSDVMARLGLYQDGPRLPAVVGYEASGVVEALGEGASRSRPGERVLVLAPRGCQAEAVVVPEGQVFSMPDGMSFEEGAALPVNYLTAYHVLFRLGNLRPGQSLLVHMAAGGVGTAALQLARTVPGVTVFGTASAAKHGFLRDSGCDHPIDYRAADYAEEVRRLTSGRGVDLVIDPLGGADWKKGYRLLRPAGLLVACGFANLAGGERRSWLRALRQILQVPRFSPLRLMTENRGVAGVYLGALWAEAALMTEELHAVLALYRQGSVRPRVDSVFPFERAADAHRRIQERKNVGKVVLVPEVI
ncbi:MAG TPA: medium chain dehydrogenase/reductase family protein [Anaeromyxobacteraceae bacterium]|nr:medium chain dehydrogenase/reductase family protein [Anaeromyxobacteraceae bacterium]